jgi:3-oxoadipate enol-lactonase
MTELLFLPGLVQDEHAYDLVGLAGHTPVYPGHGTRAPRPVTLAGLADEIASTIDRPVDVVGVALGGIVAQYLMIRHPDLVRSAVLANTPSGVGDPGQLVARAEEALLTGLAPMSDALIARWFRPSEIAADADGVRYVRACIATITPAGFAFMQQAMAGTDTAAGLPRVVAPVTLVQGLDDPVGRGSVALIHELLPDSRIVEVSGSHMVHLDNPAGMRGVIVAHQAWVDDREKRRRDGTGPDDRTSKEKP